MRVGIVTGEYPPMQGGVGAFSQILARGIARRGHDVQLFSERRARSVDPPLSGSTATWGPTSPLAIRRWAKGRRLELVNLQFQTAAYAMSPWIHFLPRVPGSIPLVTTFHDLRVPWLFPKAGRLRQRFVDGLARASAGVICTNHEDCSRLAASVALRAMIPIGSNILTPGPSAFDPALWRRRAGVDSDEFLIVWFGLINHSKGLESLLRSVAALRDDGVKTRLALVGGGAGHSDRSNAALGARIDELVAGLGLEDGLHRTGFLPDAEVAAWLRAGDLVALPFLDGASFRRGSLMAAIHHGCAVLTTSPQVDVPEFVHGKNLWLAPAGDDDALRSALAHLAAAPDTRARLRAGARRLAHRFDWDAIVDSTIAFFGRVLERQC